MSLSPIPQRQKDPKPTPERIMQLANRVLTGDIILPEFQRPFVWKRKQILDLLDSIYRNYPIGSLLVWESTQKLASKRTIADLDIQERSAAYPVNYLLDGQQRLSTVCGVLYWQPGDPKSYWNVYFDLKTEKFAHAESNDDPPVHQIPLRTLANPSDFYKRMSALTDEMLKSRADSFFNRFMDYQVALVTLGDMTIEDVAPVFERINSTGTRLTIYDLMRAATWSPDFDLGKTVESIKESLESKNFHTLDNKTFLRILGAAAGGDFSKQSIDALRELGKDDLAATAETMKIAARRAADFLATEIQAPRADALPYANQFAVLCEFFRVIPKPDTRQLQEIRRWFWRTTLSGYFSGWDSGQMSQDTKSIRDFAEGKRSDLGATGVMPSANLWTAKPFRSNSAASKMLALMLAHERPLDLVNGQLIDVDKSLAWNNDKEYHHFFPQKHLERASVKAGAANVVGNIVLLTSSSNIAILDKAPSVYLASIIDAVGRDVMLERLERSLIPEEALDAALADDYRSFLTIRAEHLQGHALALTGPVEGADVAAELVDDEDGDTSD